MDQTMQGIPQPVPFHNSHQRRKNNRQSINAIQSEKMSLGDAAKLVSFLQFISIVKHRSMCLLADLRLFIKFTPPVKQIVWFSSS